MKSKLVFLVIVVILVTNLSDAKPRVKRDIEINPEDIKLSESFPPSDKKWSWYLSRRGKNSQRSEDSEELYKDLTVDIEPRSTKCDEAHIEHQSKKEKPESEEVSEKNQKEEWRWYVKAKPNDILDTDTSLEIVTWYLKQRGRTISPQRLRASEHRTSITNSHRKTSESSTGFTKSNIINNSTETHNPTTIGSKSHTTNNILEIEEDVTVNPCLNSSVTVQTPDIVNKTETLISRLTTTGIQESTQVKTSEANNINTQVSINETTTDININKLKTVKEAQTTSKPATKESTSTTVLVTEAKTIKPSIRQSRPTTVVQTKITDVKPSTKAEAAETTTTTAVTTEAATTTTTEASEITTRAKITQDTTTTAAFSTEAKTTAAVTTEAATTTTTEAAEKTRTVKTAEDTTRTTTGTTEAKSTAAVTTEAATTTTTEAAEITTTVKTTEDTTTTDVTTEAKTTAVVTTEAATTETTEDAEITATAETTEDTTTADTTTTAVTTEATTTTLATTPSTTNMRKREVIDLYKRSYDEVSKNNSVVDLERRNRQEVGTKVTTSSSNIDEDIKDLGLPSAAEETSFNRRKKVKSYIYDTDTLLLVTALFRHGNRTVERTQYERYPNDPYKDLDYFPTGIGQLTKNGRKRAFQIGRRLRKRYRQFLGDVFYPEIVAAQSTNLDRTKMTLELVLAGLFPPSKDDEISKELQGWQPISFNYLPLAQDPALMPYFCPKFKTEYKKAVQSPNNKLVFGRNNKIFKYISDNTGVNVTDFEAVNRVFLGFQAKEDLGLKLPDWLKSIYPDPMDKMSAKYYYQLTGTNELKKMFAGNFLQQVLENIKRKMAANDGKFGKKIYLYSAHEFNVAALLASLGVYNNHTPNYGSYIIIELHVKGGVPGIKLFWENWDGRGPTLLKLSGCQTLCPLTKFVELISNIVPEEGETACQ
uniref:acid phosphatase n=1 Tax=Diabrotica virgifera virgifera TaxID=50390 RepID=A0A6P7FGS5_DIAVI